MNVSIRSFMPRLSLLILLSAACAEAQGHDFRPGEPVPDLVLPAAGDGSPMALADFRGQKLVLHVFASW